MTETPASNLLDSFLQQIVFVMQEAETTEEDEQGKIFRLAETPVFHQQRRTTTRFKEISWHFVVPIAGEGSE